MFVYKDISAMTPDQIAAAMDAEYSDDDDKKKKKKGKKGKQQQQQEQKAAATEVAVVEGEGAKVYLSDILPA